MTNKPKADKARKDDQEPQPDYSQLAPGGAAPAGLDEDRQRAKEESRKQNDTDR